MSNLLAFFALLIVIGACPLVGFKLGMYIGKQRRKPFDDIYIGLIGEILGTGISIGLAIVGAYHVEYMLL